MKESTRAKLEAAWDFCDDEDKSTGFMIQYMQDVAGVDFDCVMKFINSKSIEPEKQTRTTRPAGNKE